MAKKKRKKQGQKKQRQLLKLAYNGRQTGGGSCGGGGGPAKEVRPKSVPPPLTREIESLHTAYSSTAGVPIGFTPIEVEQKGQQRHAFAPGRKALCGAVGGIVAEPANCPNCVIMSRSRAEFLAAKKASARAPSRAAKKRAAAKAGTKRPQGP